MGKPPKAFFDPKKGCYATDALGELKRTKKGKAYRLRTHNKALNREGKDFLAAQAWLHAELAKVERNVIPADDIVFEQLCEYYLADAEARLKPEAYNRTVEHMNRFGNWPSPDDPMRMDRRLVRTITSDDADAFMAAMQAAGNSDSYITDGLLKSLKACFSWASRAREGKYPGLPLAINPLAGFKGPKVKRRKAREIDPESVTALLKWMWRRARGMQGLKQRFAKIAVILLMTLRDTGARPKELCSARWDQTEFLPDGWAVITLPEHKTSDKTGEPRIIAVPPHCTKWIRWIRDQPGSHPTHVFVHRRNRGKGQEGMTGAGEPWVATYRTGSTKSLQKWFFRIRKEAIEAGVKIGPDFRLYFNRSAFATRGLRAGVPAALLAHSMGTSETMIRRNYTDLGRDDVLNVARAAFRGAAPPSDASSRPDRQSEGKRSS